jgi:hypothetical protein
LVHNYSDETASIRAQFEGNFSIVVYVDPIENLIYAEPVGGIPGDVERIFGFIPPLGPLSESEEILVNESHLRASLNTSLAPRHLRNHFVKLLSAEDYELVKQIVRSTWEDIELLDYEVKYTENRINCYYREQRVDREIAWAGQGLQVWFQIIAHLVRLRECSVLVLDEPEINLHPEKQNDLIRIIREQFRGSIVIATHSVELMNNVSVSHIINVQKKATAPRIKATSDRAYLDIVRSQIGSNFNLIASQFEDCDAIVFTEDVADFAILKELAIAYGIRAKVFNVPLHGFSEFPKAISYKSAYKMLIGKDVRYSMLLDRDFYPDDYLKEVRDKLATDGIKLVFTIGKEIENMFLLPHLIKEVVPAVAIEEFNEEYDALFEAERGESIGSFLTLHKNFLPARVDVKTVAKKYLPAFEARWKDRNVRHEIVSGKAGLGMLRDFIKRTSGKNVTTKVLVKRLAAMRNPKVTALVEGIFGK